MTHVVIDLTEVEYLQSIGIALLADTQRSTGVGSGDQAFVRA